MNAAIYCRVSTEQQEDRDSLKTQQERLTAYCVAQGWRLTFAPFIDSGLSAKDANRPALQAMLTECRNGRIDAVLVTKIDRISRSLKDLLKLIDFFEEKSIKFVSLAETLDTRSPMGRFMIVLLGAVAELERMQTAERVATDMRHIAKKGRFTGGVVPYGYKLFEKKLVIDEAEAAIVRRIFTQYIACNSLRRVTHNLTKDGIKTRRGALWAAVSVRRILTTPTYAGRKWYGKRRTNPAGKLVNAPENEWILADGEQAAIIDEATFEAAARLLKSHVKPLRHDNYIYLLRGLLRCAYCGGGITAGAITDKRGKTPITRRRYFCNTHVQKSEAACRGIYVNADELEEAVVEALKKEAMQLDPHKLAGLYIEQTAAQDIDLDAIVASIHDANRRRSNLLRAIESGIDDAAIRARYDAIVQEISGLEQRKETAAAVLQDADGRRRMMEEAIKDLLDFGKGFDTLPREQQQQRIHAIIAGGTLSDEGVELVKWIDEEAETVLRKDDRVSHRKTRLSYHFFTSLLSSAIDAPAYRRGVA